MPQCAEIKSLDGTDVVVEFRPASVLCKVDHDLEKDWSRRYWSTEFPDSSRGRMKDCTRPPVGIVDADPRTFHGAVQTQA
jgi:hypothetical protein